MTPKKRLLEIDEADEAVRAEVRRAHVACGISAVACAGLHAAMLLKTIYEVPDEEARAPLIAVYNAQLSALQEQMPA